MTDEIQQQYMMQENLQRQQMEGQQALYAPTVHEKIQENQAVIIEQTNPKKIIDGIILLLKGLEKDETGAYVKMSEPKLNKEGIDDISFILHSHINQNTIYSHIEREDVGKLTLSVANHLREKLSLNWKKYGIKDKSDLDTVMDAVTINIFLALKRSEQQNEKNWVGKITVESVSGTKLPSPKKDGFWSKLKL